MPRVAAPTLTTKPRRRGDHTPRARADRWNRQDGLVDIEHDRPVTPREAETSRVTASLATHQALRASAAYSFESRTYLMPSSPGVGWADAIPANAAIDAISASAGAGRTCPPMMARGSSGVVLDPIFVAID